MSLKHPKNVIQYIYVYSELSLQFYENVQTIIVLLDIEKIVSIYDLTYSTAYV